MLYQNSKNFLFLFGLIFFIANCKTKRNPSPDAPSVETSNLDESNGLELITQETLRTLFHSPGLNPMAYNPVTRTNDIPCKELTLSDGSELTIRQYTVNGQLTYAVTTGKYPNVKFYVFDKDLPSAFTTGAKKSFADKVILDKLQLIPEIKTAFADHYRFEAASTPRVGVYFDEIPKISGGNVANTFDVYITRADMEALVAYKMSGTALPETLMAKINKLNHLILKQPSLFVRVSGHGWIGQDGIIDESPAPTKRALSGYPDYLKLMLGDATPSSIHLELNSCYGGACPVDGGKSMLHTGLEEFQKQFPTTRLQGGASPSMVNYAHDPAGTKYIWAAKLEGGVWSLGPVDVHTAIGGYVDASLQDGRISYAVVGVAGKNTVSTDPAIKDLVDARARIISLIPRQTGPAHAVVSTAPFETATAAEVQIVLLGGEGSPTAKKFAQLSLIDQMLQGRLAGTLSQADTQSLARRIALWDGASSIIRIRPLGPPAPPKAPTPPPLPEKAPQIAKEVPPPQEKAPPPPEQTKQKLVKPEQTTELPKQKIVKIEQPKIDFTDKFDTSVPTEKIGNRNLYIGIGIGAALAVTAAAAASGYEIMVLDKKSLKTGSKPE